MRTNNAQPDRPQMTTWRKRIEWWIPKATNTHSEHVTYSFPTLTVVTWTCLDVTFISTLSVLFIVQKLKLQDKRNRDTRSAKLNTKGQPRMDRNYCTLRCLTTHFGLRNSNAYEISVQLQGVRANRKCGRPVGQLPAPTEYQAVDSHGSLHSYNGSCTQNLLTSRFWSEGGTANGYKVTRFRVRHVWSSVLLAR
jgi:hypothetical protein